MKKLPLSILLVLFAAAPAFGTTYYIDYASGNDSNAGTSASAPWRHCPGAIDFTGTYRHPDGADGDTFLFKGGVEYKGNRIHLLYSGSPSVRMTYDGNSAGTWGTGKAVINGEHSTDPGRQFAFYGTSGKQHIAIKNFEIKHLGGHPYSDQETLCSGYSCTSPKFPGIPGTAFYLQNYNHVTIQSNYIHEISDWENNAFCMIGTGTGSQYRGIGIQVNGASSNIVIDSNEITKCAFIGISIEPAGSGTRTMQNITITNNLLHGFMHWGILFSPKKNGAVFNEITIANNRFYDWKDYAKWKGCPGTYPHCDQIFFQGSATTKPLTWGNFYVYGNDFYYVSGSGVLFLSGAGGNIKVYNNRFIGHNGPNAVIYVQDAPTASLISASVSPLTLQIYNNSFYDAYKIVYLRSLRPSKVVGTDGKSYACRLTHRSDGTNQPITGANWKTYWQAAAVTTKTRWSSGVTYTEPSVPCANGNTVRIKNNAFYLDNTGLVMPVSLGATDICSTSNPTELDYNAYFTRRGDGRVIGICNTSTQKVTYVSVSGVRGMGLGYEAHGYQGDPRWVDISKGLRSVSCGANDLHLQSGSPLRGAGTDLSTIFKTDKDGKARSSWDIGAYEFSLEMKKP